MPPISAAFFIVLMTKGFFPVPPLSGRLGGASSLHFSATHIHISAAGTASSFVGFEIVDFVTERQH